MSTNLKLPLAGVAACAVVLLAVLAGTRGAKVQAAGTSVTIEGGAVLPQAAMRASLTAALADGEDIDAFDISVTFDPSVVRALAIVPGDGWIALPVAGAGIDNVGGAVRMVAIRPSGAPTCRPTCTLVSVEWFGVAVGRSPLKLSTSSGPTFAHNGQALTGFVVQEGEVIVGAYAATATPSFTPSPTASTVPSTPDASPSLPSIPPKPNGTIPAPVPVTARLILPLVAVD